MKTYKHLNKIGIGTSAYGSRVKPSDSENLIKELLNLGINYIDTSPMYGAGHAEKIIGRSYEDRSKVILATKFGLTYKKKGKIYQMLIPIARLLYNFPIINQILRKRAVSHDELPFTIDEIKKSVARSLNNLNTNYLDVLFIHNNIEFYLNNKIVMSYLIELKKKNIIRKLGITTSLTNENLKNLIISNKDVIDIIQIPLSNYNYFSNLDIQINCFSAFSQGNIDEKQIFNYLENGNGRLIVLFKTQHKIIKNISFFNLNG